MDQRRPHHHSRTSSCQVSQGQPSCRARSSGSRDFLFSFSRVPRARADSGIGQYTILDSKIVDGSDIGNNFFLETSSLGKSRAEEVTRLVGELNNDVKGTAVVKVRIHPRQASAIGELTPLVNRTWQRSYRPSPTFLATTR